MWADKRTGKKDRGTYASVGKEETVCADKLRPPLNSLMSAPLNKHEASGTEVHMGVLYAHLAVLK